MNTDEIRHLYDYTEWANELVLGAAEKLSEEQLLQDVGISHKSILGTLAHMGGAEWIWLERWLGHSPTGPDAWAQWTTDHCHSVQQLRASWQPIISQRRTYLSGLTDDVLPRDLSFVRLNGEKYSMPLVHQMQ